MPRTGRGAILLALMSIASATIADAGTHRDAAFAGELAFEVEQQGGAPTGWAGHPAETVHFDDAIVHAGRFAARLERDAESASTFSVITRAIPVDFPGEHIALDGYMRTRDVEGWAGLWMRVDGTSGTLAFDNMQDRHISGSTEWTHYRIELELSDAARSVYFGALVAGAGAIWADDFALTVDGVPIEETAVHERMATVLEQDTEFDDGSGVDVATLSDLQVRNLDLLCRVWGFLKYHHPVVADGRLHWDYALFRVLPTVLSVSSTMLAREAITAWADTTLGMPPLCSPCASLPDSLALTPDLAWLHDRTRLGPRLHGYLNTIYERRHRDGGQFYVSLSPGVGNPAFDNESAYKTLPEIDAGYRILALFRYWNIIQYWFPYRDVIGADWNGVIAEFLPRFVAATSREAYLRTLHALIVRVNDTHANLWSALGARPPGGDCVVAAALRPVRERAVVFDVTGDGVPLQRGDVITAVDGTPVSSLVETWTPYYAASNEPTRWRDMMHALTRGDCGPCALRIERGADVLEVEAARVSDPPVARFHDRRGDGFQRLSDEIAYLKLSDVTHGEAASYVQQAAGTRGLVIDLRCYPSDFMVFALGAHLVSKPTGFACFTRGDVANPGAFRWTQPVTIEPATPHYEGRLAILVDETTQSQAEYTTMAFRAVPGAVVVGSTTAGADGNASWFPLPGGERSMISGIGIFYPDHTPTQRVGIVPDIEVHPTVEGLREGRDEVLEAAIRHLLGPKAAEADIRRMAAY